MTSLRDRIKLRADEAAAYDEDQRRTYKRREAHRDRLNIERDLCDAVDAVNDFFEGQVSIKPSALYPLDRPRWKKCWAFTLLGLPLEVRANVFFGLRLMNGENSGEYDAGGPGRILNSLADLADVI